MKTKVEPRLRTAGLFAGIGGLEAGLERAGHITQLLCEIDEGAKAVLEERFPTVPLHADVTKLKRLPADIDLLTAGFPCQDLSQAGQTHGLAGRQSSLVEHVFRLLKATDVPWVLLENVPFMLQLGKGAAMRYVVEKLERLGYAWAYRVIDSRAFGLPQRRERVYLLASKVADPARILFDGNHEPIDLPAAGRRPCGFYWTEGLRGLGWAVDAVPTLKGGSTIGIPSPPAIWMIDGQFVTPDIRDAERLQGFAADWTLPANSACRSGHRWKLVGNAVSVPVAEWIGKRICAAPSARPVLATAFDPKATWPRAAMSADGDRAAVRATTWPVRLEAASLADFLCYPTKLLSQRALAGFYSRLCRSSLNRPDAFDRDIRKALGLPDDTPRVRRPRAVRGRASRSRPGAAIIGE